MRPLPQLTPENEFFWTSGADGVLRMQGCDACDRLIHPPQPYCRYCAGEVTVRDLTGEGTVVGFTVNHQQWLPTMPVPYVLVIVALDEDPLARLTSLVVDAKPDDVGIGTRVKVDFEEHEDVWLPVFRLSGEADDERDTWPEPEVAPAPPRASGDKYEDKVAITGLGMSEVGRRLGRNPLSLTVDACRAAIEDAGLRIEDIDGLSTYPGSGTGNGMGEGGVPAVMEALDIRPVWFGGGVEQAGQGGSVTNAMMAVAAGVCRHVLCFRTVWETSFALRAKHKSAAGIKAGPRVSGEMEWRLPYGAMSAATWIGMQANHYMHRFGMTRAQLGWIPMTARAHAARNPTAIYQDAMDLDDYLGARMITTPFGLYDCDVPCDGAVALIVSAVETAEDRPHPAVRVEAVGTHLAERFSWDQGTLLHEPLVEGPARHLWSRTDLGPSDVDIACLYDGFSFNCLSWIESLGFCKLGEGGDYIDGGARIREGGDFVLNPHGGQLSAGRLHGYGFFHEAVLQLRGEAGGRQVADAKTALVTTGGGHPGGAVMLRKD
ncbi:MAG: thiolase C-terminal domain-containing protein [Myxococcota bacterium]